MTAREAPVAPSGNRAGLKREMAIIPTLAYVIAALVFIGVPVLFNTFVWRDPASRASLFPLVISFFPGTMLAFLTLMVGYVNQDAGRRGMSRTLWTLLVIFIPNAIGFILYFLLRSPIRVECPKCGTVVDPQVNYCPNCRYGFHPTCPQCQTSVRPGDTFCKNCGTQINQVA
jgi:tellurite resistance protein TehA-like permease